MKGTVCKYKIRLVRDGAVKYPYSDEHVKQSDDIYRIIKPLFDGLDREQTVVVALDTRGGVVGVNIVSIGTINASLFSPREIFKFAILANATDIVIAHNHPSGEATPSPEDVKITKQIADGGEIIGIRLLDHLVLGEYEYQKVTIAHRGDHPS